MNQATFLNSKSQKLIFDKITDDPALVNSDSPEKRSTIIAALTSPEKHSDQALLVSVKKLIGEERRIGLEILKHLSEISKRRLYSQLGYQSLFDYCVRELRYSEGAAQRRVLATRALQSIPAADEALRSGQLSVTTLALFQEVSHKAKVQEIEKAPLLKQIYGLSKSQSEKKLFELTGIYSKAFYEKKKTISATQTQVTLTLTDAQLQILELAKGRLAHRLKEGTYAELIALLAEMAIEQTTPKSTSPEKRSTKVVPLTSLEKCNKKYPVKTTATTTAARSRKSTRFVPTALRAKIWAKAKSQCEKCQSTYALQIDHHVPFSISRNSGPENLRLLCRHCNLAEARKWGVG